MIFKVTWWLKLYLGCNLSSHIEGIGHDRKIHKRVRTTLDRMSITMAALNGKMYLL